ncbi:MAG: regulatory protein RecX [Candidatus Nanopelagicales bacterium]|jgi:regulatory protein
MRGNGSAPIDIDADPVAVARTIALRRLEAAPRTRFELTKTLRERHVPEEAIVEVLDRFEEVGLIDDTAFAHGWVESRHRGRGLGRRALAQELQRKGIPQELIIEATSQLCDEDERERARQLAMAKLRVLANVADDVAVRRLAGQLARRGYAPGMAFDVAREVVAERG